MTVRNGTTAQVTSWTTVLDLRQASFGNGWNATLTVQGSQLTARPLDWNRVLGPGGAASFGYCANKTGGTWQPVVVSASGG